MNNIERSKNIDFVKGSLVIVMVAYHTLNYFLEGRPMLYGYLYYVGQAFIFYSGFICGTIYLEKFNINKKYVFYRLLIRSLKLISLFFLINIIIQSLLKKNYYGQEFGIDIIINNIYHILLDGAPNLMAFEILLPIAYVLMISAFLLNFTRLKIIFYIALILLFLLITFFKINITYNFYCSLIGIAGFYTGSIFKDLKYFINKKIFKYIIIILLLLYFIFLIPFEFNVRDNFICFFLYINIIILNIFLLGNYLNPLKFITRYIIKFGQYSLCLYIAQIFFLQILYKILNFKSINLTITHFIIFILINSFLIIFCNTADYLRGKFFFADKAYRFIFS